MPGHTPPCRSRAILGPAFAALVWVFAFAAATSVIGDFADNSERVRLAAEADFRCRLFAGLAVASLLCAMVLAAGNWRTARGSSLVTISMLALFGLTVAALVTSAR
jgi:hypothetical protein